MYQVNEDLSIYITRGDAASFTVTAKRDGSGYQFPAGSVVRLKVSEKKGCDCVVLQKDFSVETASNSVDISLTEADTRIGSVIHKPKDYWYEVELNPFSDPQTIIGYDEDGAKVFRLFPEGKDVEGEILPEDIPVVDKELSMTSERPIQNQAVARKFAEVEATIQTNKGSAETELAKMLPKSGGTMTGNIAMGGKKITGLGTPSANTDAVNKAYADQKLPKSGGTMTGNLDMGSNRLTGLVSPTANTDAATKEYADKMLPKSGGTMTGNLDMGHLYRIKNLNTPEDDFHAANKHYVDVAVKEAEDRIDNELDNMEAGIQNSRTQMDAYMKQYVSMAIGNASTETELKIQNAVKQAAPYNFLDNSNFNQLVDQRGSGTYTGAGYGFDRWVSLNSQLTAKKIAYTNTTTNTKEGLLQLKNANTSEAVVYGQRISPEISEWMRGKTFTFAICMLDGMIIACSGTCSAADLTDAATKIQFSATGSGGVGRIEVIKVAETQNFTARIIIKAGGTVALRWAALYEGEYTADSLPAYHSKGYAAELNECRRYYQKFGNSFKVGVLTTGGTLLRLGIPLPVPLRLNNPTMTIINASGLRTVTGSNMEPEIGASTCSVYPDGSLLVDLTIMQLLGTPNNTPVALYFSAELSAEL